MGKTKKCAMCGMDCEMDEFPITTSIFFPDGHGTICLDCLANLIEEAARTEKDWALFCRICQWLDYPFDADIYLATKKTYGRDVLKGYSIKYAGKAHNEIDWQASQDHYKQLRENSDNPDAGVRAISDQQVGELREFWGSEYTAEELILLERKYNNLNNTQHISTEVQSDAAVKLCKISLNIDKMLRNNDPSVDKMIKVYDSLIKVGNFTSANAKNGCDFDSMGEIGKYLEQRGFINQFYDGKDRDALDALMKNIAIHNTRLYTQETGIPEEINRRVEQLKTCRSIENDPYAEIGLNYNDENLVEYDDEVFEEDLDG